MHYKRCLLTSYRVEKVGIYMLSLAKNSIFVFFVRNYHLLYSNSIWFLDLGPISLNFFPNVLHSPPFKMLGTLFNLDLFLYDFLRKSWKLQKSHFFDTTLEQYTYSKTTINSSFWRKECQNCFWLLICEKPSLYINLRSV